MKTINEYPLVSIISVNYNGADLTCEMIKSLRNITYPNIEIIVVDNASHESPAKIKDSNQDITLILSEKNIGFAGGNNIGIRASKGKYILLLNNDTEVDTGFLEPLVEKLEMNSHIGGVSPKVYYYNTSIIQFAGSTPINAITGRGGFIGELEADMGQYDVDKICNHTHGAAMLVPRSVLEKVGLMSEFFFLYYEELDFCEKIKRAGYEFWYIHSSKVYHKESMSVGKKSSLKTFYQTRNRILFMKRNVKAYQYFLFCVYYALISIPKNIVSYILKRDWNLLIAYINGVKWNLKKQIIPSDPVL